MRRQPYACPEPSRRGSEIQQCSKSRFSNLGVIVKPHGVRGELSVSIFLQDMPQMEEISLVYLGPETQPRELQSARFHQGNLLLKVVGCDDRSTADAMRGMEVWIESADKGPLGRDEYYVHDLVGLNVVDEHGDHLGVLVEVIITGANDVYRVDCDQGEILLPAIKDVVREVHTAAGEMRVRLLPGMR